MLPRFRQHHRSLTWTAKQLNDSLNLPKTTLPLRVDYGKVEEKHRKTISHNLYHRQALERRDAPVYIIHDGPPFANADLHIGNPRMQKSRYNHLGHALNKMIKDTILRVKLEKGYRVELYPGWDCHGLPIELKALSKMQGRPSDAVHLRSICRQYAEEAISRQKGDMMQWGLLADYDRPILTMDPAYEAAQLNIFAEFVERGLIFQDKRPVYWSPSSRSALAEAELEYEDDHISTACFVKFPLLEERLEDGRKLSLLIWTTAPWTLPANQAIGINANLQYILVRLNEDETVVVLNSCLQNLYNLAGQDLKVLGHIDKQQLLAFKYLNPWYPQVANPVIAVDFVTSDSGTGLVHLAPAHGREDFLACRSENLPERLIVGEDGRYNSAAPPSLQGRSIFGDGPNQVLQELREQGLLLATQGYKHRYPYDWRTKKPVIQLATPQWFIQTRTIAQELQSALEGIQFIPTSGKRRLSNMLSSRTEWCISRQRSWGVPIPVFYDSVSGGALIDAEIVRFVAEKVREGGSDVWWTAKTQDLLPPAKQHLADSLQRGTDTLDVWYDSGTFWKNASGEAADVYIEGTDQYRGWFQSSLVTSVVARGRAPFKALIAHGFVLDEKGLKMSKSLGNVIPPAKIIASGGTDLLRLWAVSSHFTQDIALGAQNLSRLQEFRQKLRNTFRFMIANCQGGTLASTTAPKVPLLPLDQLMARMMGRVSQETMDHYESFSFADGLSVIDKFIQEDLSAFYFDVIKNRLYLPPLTDPSRLSAVNTLQVLIARLSSLARPIAPYLAAEILEHGALQGVEIDEGTGNHAEDLECWDRLKSVRQETLQILKALISKGELKSTYQAFVGIDDSSLGSITSRTGMALGDLAELLSVAGVVPADPPVPSSPAGVFFLKGGEIVTVYRSELEKCPRCWIHRLDTMHEVCRDCFNVISCKGNFAREAL